MNEFFVKGGRSLKSGYTTGSCATAAATGAALMLKSGHKIDKVEITLPGGQRVTLALLGQVIDRDFASCYVIKDGGDDPDVTHGLSIYATVSHGTGGQTITGGEGIGIVRSKGLKCPRGDYAINPVPRAMIAANVGAVLADFHVALSVPNGEIVAKNTFNPRLGIEGGISILGTTGIVEPMSERALIDTIHIVMDKARAEGGETLLLSFGNYGREFCREKLGFDLEYGVKCSNFIGEALDYGRYLGFPRVLLVGHVGKMVKLAAGIMQTHSSVADGRMEILSAHAALCGGDKALIFSLMEAKTTAAALDILENAGLLPLVIKSVCEKIKFQLDYRTKGVMNVEFYLFGEEDTLLYKSEKAEEYAGMVRQSL